MTAPSAAEPDSPINSKSPTSISMDALQPDESPSALQKLIPAFIMIVAFLARLIPASRLFLNPDEALHYLLASQASFGRAWDAALTNAHPPLLILVLYYWRFLGHSELWLRMPSVLTGTCACWLIYQWLKLIIDKTAALLGLLLFSFAPSLILLSAEIRQYALLLFFESASLYFAERALQKNSARAILLFSLSLYGSLLTHYSALIFAFAIGIYMLVRLYPYGSRLKLSSAWAAGQLGGISVASYFMLTHIPHLRQTGMVRADLESYLRKSIFQPSKRNPLEFVISQTVRVFTYIFSHGLIGGLMFMAFLAGIIWLLRSKTSPDREEKTSYPSSRELALLLAVPFLVSWGVAIAGLYPLGATRHDAFLAPFVILGACVGIAGWIPARNRTKRIAIVFVIIIALAICNFLPAPSPPIRAKNQSAALMRESVSYLRASAPVGTIFLTDYESGLLLGYYLCGHGVVQVFPPLQPFSIADCGSYKVVATSFHDWKFLADTFPAKFADATKSMPPSTEVWLFYAGWINDSAPALKQELRQFGCTAPKSFGENILVCRLTTKKSKQ
jgi:uncharacterized membrane protein